MKTLMLLAAMSLSTTAVHASLAHFPTVYQGEWCSPSMDGRTLQTTYTRGKCDDDPVSVVITPDVYRESDMTCRLIAGSDVGPAYPFSTFIARAKCQGVAFGKDVRYTGRIKFVINFTTAPPKLTSDLIDRL
jgi:hypothetical protein